MEVSSELVILYKIPIFTGVSLVYYKISSAFDRILDCTYTILYILVLEAWPKHTPIRI